MLSVSEGAGCCWWPEADACGWGRGDEVSVNVSCTGRGSFPLTFSLMNKDARSHLLSLQDLRPGEEGELRLVQDSACNPERGRCLHHGQHGHGIATFVIRAPRIMHRALG